MQEKIRFSLSISAEDFLAYYRGEARQVLVRAHDGRRVSFPAERLRPFVTQAGVRGDFEMVIDGQRRCVSLRRI